MAVQKLAQNGALGMGADLWIVPDPNSSPWSRKIDWYLNFQIARALRRSPSQFSTSLESIVQSNSLKLPQPLLKKDAPLMVASSQLPVRQVVLLPFKEEKEWLKSSEKVWKNLGRPRLRIFLPLGMSEGACIQFWSKDEDSIELSYVPGDLPLEA